MKVCSISLDAEEYKKDLEKVVSQTKNSINELNKSVNNTLVDIIISALLDFI